MIYSRSFSVHLSSRSAGYLDRGSDFETSETIIMAVQNHSGTEPVAAVPVSSKASRLDGGTEDSRPRKHQKVSSHKGQDSIPVDEPYIMTAPTGTSRDIEAFYLRRRKIAKYAAAIRQKQALARKVNGDWSRMPITGQKGMANFTGALCYRHSLLQVLLHLPKFVNWLVAYHRQENCVSDDSKKCLSCRLRVLIQEYWRVGRDKKSGLSKVLLELDRTFKSLGWSPGTRSGQADPDEQVAWMLGVMRGEMPSSTFAYFEAINHLVTNSLVKCGKCGHESKTEAHDERLLSVPIQPRVRNGFLSKYLQRYMDEVVDDYRCESCNDKGPKRRLQEIGHGPDTLLVQLKRFNWDGTKDNSAVGIDLTLDLSRYSAATNHQPLRYELAAVIKHAGSSGSGHYISSVKGSDGRWYCFDDSKISAVSVKEATSGVARFTPYMLFFQRKWD